MNSLPKLGLSGHFKQIKGLIEQRLASFLKPLLKTRLQKWVEKATRR